MLHHTSDINISTLNYMKQLLLHNSSSILNSYSCSLFMALKAWKLFSVSSLSIFLSEVLWACEKLNYYLKAHFRNTQSFLLCNPDPHLRTILGFRSIFFVIVCTGLGMGMGTELIQGFLNIFSSSSRKCPWRLIMR